MDTHLWPGMNHKHTLLERKGDTIPTLIALRLHERFAKWAWAHATKVVFSTTGNSKGTVLEVQSNKPLAEREVGILIGYAEAWADTLQPFILKETK